MTDRSPETGSQSTTVGLVPLPTNGATLGRALWLVNAACFGLLVAWILSDGRFPNTVDALRTELISRVVYGAPGVSAPDLASRVSGLTGLCLLALVSTVSIFVALFVGSRAHRSLRSWFAFTMLIAAWLTLISSWPELAWRGQALRLSRSIATLEPLATSLRADWPADDGERPGIGPFMAYPIGNPKMIMLLRRPELTGSTTTFSTVERGADALRFQLSGVETGAWLEWHAPGTAPDSFLGGLMTEYRLQRSAPLGRGWYLTRYSAQPPVFEIQQSDRAGNH